MQILGRKFTLFSGLRWISHSKRVLRREWMGLKLCLIFETNGPLLFLYVDYMLA